MTLLLAGTTCSYEKKEDGRRHVFSFHHAGDFCDLYQYVSPEHGGVVGVQALSDVEVGVIDQNDMDELLTSPELAVVFWRAALLQISIHRQRQVNAGRESGLQRVAHLLCEQLVLLEGEALLPLAQDDIADAVGLEVLHVDYAIQALRNRKVLSKASQSIEVIDREKLARIANFHGGYLAMPQLLAKWTVQVEH